MQKKSDAYMAYASDYSEGYEPVAFAAVSLHPPMPVLHIISPNPMSPMRPNALASSMSHAYAKPYARPYAPYGGYERGYERGYGYGQGFKQGYEHDYDLAPEQSHKYNTILYARPDKYGGYTYYRKTKNIPKKPNKKPNRPVILRIHKYRIVRDR